MNSYANLHTNLSWGQLSKLAYKLILLTVKQTFVQTYLVKQFNKLILVTVKQAFMQTYQGNSKQTFLQT